MARLNLTVPDSLYERLERVRDRVNVSKVCAVALEKELDLMEARPAVADQKIARLLERLKGSREVWYQRGHDDGTVWAIEEAGRDQLQAAAHGFRGYNGWELSCAYPETQDGAAAAAEAEETEGTIMSMLPGLNDLEDRKKRWVLHDLDLEEVPDPYRRSNLNLNSTLRDQLFDGMKRFDRAYVEADSAAYLEGWRDALVELWEAVAPALR